MTTFKKIISLSVVHPYFEEDKCNCLSFRPTPNTAKAIKAYGFIFKESINGFEFISRENFDFNYLLNHTEIVSFDFDFTSTNSNFLSFTKIPLDWKGTLKFSAKNKKLDFNLSNETSSVPGVIGNVTFPIKEQGSFTMNFQARSTAWKYYVINQSHIDLEGTTISGKDQVTFLPPIDVKLSNGQRAKVYSSGDIEFPMKRNAKSHLQLRLGKKIILNALPIPYADAFEIDEIKDERKVFSPVYIYV